MEDQLKQLVQHIDSVMDLANKVKKTADTPAGLAASLESYTASLDALLTFTENIDDELGNIELPAELTESVAEGKRPEDYNRQVRQDLEATLVERRNCSEGFLQLWSSIAQKFKGNQGPTTQGSEYS